MIGTAANIASHRQDTANSVAAMADAMKSAAASLVALRVLVLVLSSMKSSWLQTRAAS